MATAQGGPSNRTHSHYYDFGRVADIYDATRALDPDDMRRVIDTLSLVFSPGAYIVDVGVGTGRFAEPLQKVGYTVCGVDASRKMVAKAREKEVRELVFGDIQMMPFRDGAFDFALLVHVLHLVSDWKVVVRESARVVQQDIVSVLDRTEGDDLGALYKKARTELGYPLHRPVGTEKGFQGAFHPDRAIEVLVTDRESSFDEEILHLERREQSATWDVPDSVHDSIIERLKKDLSGATLSYTSTIDVAVWSSSRLLRALEEEG